MSNKQILNIMSKKVISTSQATNEAAIEDLTNVNAVLNDDKKDSKKEPRITKKMVVIEFLDRPEGGLPKDIAQAIVDRKMDPDFDKNLRVVKLWLSKIGFPVVKGEDGAYHRK